MSGKTVEARRKLLAIACRKPAHLHGPEVMACMPERAQKQGAESD